MATTWNPSDKAANVTLSGGNLVATLTAAPAGGDAVRSTPATSGNQYYEFTVTGGNLIAIGISSTSDPVGDYISAVWASCFDAHVYANGGGTDLGAFAGSAFSSGDILCVCWDRNNRRIWFRKNGGNWNNSGSADPSTGAGSLNLASYFAGGETLCMWAYFNVEDGVVTMNAGATGFTYPVPSGFYGPDSRQLTLAADQGSFTLSGQAASLVLGRLLTAVEGIFTLNGQDAAFSAGRNLPADYAAFVLSGQDADLLRSYTLSGGDGSFGLAGQDATLSVMRLLVGDHGSFSLSGQDAGFALMRVLAAENGTFVLNGQDVDLLRSLQLVADNGVVVLSGQDADFALGKTITADFGAFALAGQDASLVVGRLIAADYGLFTLAGQDADLLAARLLAAGFGAFVLSGQDAALAVGKLLAADYGVFTLAGQDAIIDISAIQGYLAALEQQDVALIYGNVTGTGQFTVSGPYVIQAFTTDDLSFPYDVRQRTA